jgi:hypothetical protein
MRYGPMRDGCPPVSPYVAGELGVDEATSPGRAIACSV